MREEPLSQCHSYEAALVFELGAIFTEPEAGELMASSTGQNVRSWMVAFSALLVAGIALILSEAFGIVAHGAIIGSILVVVTIITYVSTRRRLG